MDALVQDVRFALRTFARQPAFTLVAIATLALGIGANTAIFTVVNAVVLEPLPFAAGERLVRVTADLPGLGTSDIGLSVPEMFDYRDRSGLFEEIAGVGGVVAGLETGWLQRKISESAARQQWEIEQHRRVIVGVNEFVTNEDELTIPILKVGEETEREQRVRLAALRRDRDNAACQQALDALRSAARGSQNTMPFILECARRYATLYEIRAALEDVFGAYREPVFF